MHSSLFILVSATLIIFAAAANPTRETVHKIGQTDPRLNVVGSVQSDHFYEIVFDIVGTDGIFSFVPDWVFQFGVDTVFKGESEWPSYENIRVSMLTYPKAKPDAVFDCKGIFDLEKPSSGGNCDLIFSNDQMSFTKKMYVTNGSLTSDRSVSIVFTSVAPGAAGTVNGTLVLQQAHFFSWLGDSFTADRLVIIGMTAALIVVLFLSLVTSCFAYACSTVEGPFKLSVAYPLCFFLGFTGVQRFYLGQPHVGKIYACSLGLFGLGWLFDLLFLSRLVTQSNLLALLMASEIQNGHYSLAESRAERSRGSSRGSVISREDPVLPPSSGSGQFLRSKKRSTSNKHVSIGEAETTGPTLECISDDFSDLEEIEAEESSGHYERPTTGVALAAAHKKLRGKGKMSKAEKKQKLAEAKKKRKEIQAAQKEKKRQAKEDKKALKAALRSNNVILDEDLEKSVEREDEMVVEDVMDA